MKVKNMKVFDLPDLGEGLTDATILEWFIKEGDMVKADDLMVSVETAKSVVEIPAPISGKVLKINAKVGESVNTGSSLVEFEEDDKPDLVSDFIAEEKDSSANHTFDQGSFGRDYYTDYSAQDYSADYSARDYSAQASFSPIATYKGTGSTVVGSLQVDDSIISEDRFFANLTNNNDRKNDITANFKALPKVRALAKSLGVDLAKVQPSGKNFEITEVDVLSYANKPLNNPSSSQEMQEKGVKEAAPPGFEPLTGMREGMALKMAHATNQKIVNKDSASPYQIIYKEVVPAIIVDDAVVPDEMQPRDLTKALIKAMVAGCQKEPVMNAWFDGETLSMSLMEEINIGLAVDSANGLFVPVIKNAQKLSSIEIIAQIQSLKEKTQAGQLSVEDTKGATIVLSNFGVFAGRYGSPIIMPPTVAILAAGRLRTEVGFKDGQVVPQKVLPLSLSFNHRVITGGEAARFLKTVMENLV